MCSVGVQHKTTHTLSEAIFSVVVYASIVVPVIRMPTSILAENVAQIVDFDRDIRPILSDKCYVCHGPDAESRQAELRLDRQEGIADYLIVAGKPDESELVRRIMSDDEAEQMPPHDSHLTLSSEEKALLVEWIRQGAVFTEHWSFRPLPAHVTVPNVADSTWPRNEIDRFVRVRLERDKLSPSPRAEPLRLLRRATLDLTGLPPTSEEIRNLAREAKEDLDGAYSRTVDRLLSSNAYGEHMAVAWLDAARYADSHGYNADKLNTQWPYRDWVVRAYNSNLPYDAFLTWQLAGDLLPNSSTDQILATAFNRLHRMTSEGGSIAEECLVENVADRVQTFGTAILGLTIECARCHDHKYDPISARDYYSIAAFFNSIDENGMYDATEKVPSPSLLLPTELQVAQLRHAREKVAQAEKELELAKYSGQDRFNAWLLKAQTSRDANCQRDSEVDLVGYFSFDGASEECANQVLGSDYVVKLNDIDRVDGICGQAIRFDGDRGVEFPDLFQFDRWDELSFDFWIRDAARNLLPVVVLQRTFGTDVGYNGVDIMLVDGCVDVRMYRVWPGNGFGVRTTKPIARNSWQHIAISYDGSSKAAGIRVYVNGKEVSTLILRDRISKRLMVDEYGNGHFTLGHRFRDRGFRDGALDEFRCFNRALTPLEVECLHDGHAFARAIAAPNEHREMLHRMYCSAIDSDCRRCAKALLNARHALVKVEECIQEVAVMEELPQPRPTYILSRGAYDAPKSEDNRVRRDTFSEILIPFPKDALRNRLGLAEWLTAPDHPLTARVFVNRLWMQFFGEGLVTTPENFGRQGARPTHPELLDWLARDFVNHGWDVKRLCRQILLSATYQQDSRQRPELRDADPENHLLARGPSHRLSAEQIRDLALAASGLLSRDVGGPPVSPYQPGNDLWRESNGFSPSYQQSTGKNLYRRSLYSVWKRTAPLPNMSAFDVPTREVCAVTRGRTSTPLQALVLLNDVQFVEAARVLATSVSNEYSKVDEQIAAAFLRLTSREPDGNERELLSEIYSEQFKLFDGKDSKDAEMYTKLGESKSEAKSSPAELAALTATCQVIMNLDATIYER